MNATIFEFSSARNLLNRAALSSAGFSDVTRWQLCGIPGDTYEVGALIAEPDLVAINRTRGLCIVHFVGGSRRELTAVERLTGQLNAAVCAEALTVGCGLHVATRWVFDEDERYTEAAYPRDDLRCLLLSARQQVANKGSIRARTQDAARAICHQLP